MALSAEHESSPAVGPPPTVSAVEGSQGLDPAGWEALTADAYLSMTLPYLRYSEQIGPIASYLVASDHTGYVGALRYEVLGSDADAVDGPLGIIVSSFRGNEGEQFARELVTSWGTSTTEDPVGDVRRVSESSLFPAALVFSPFEGAVLTRVDDAPAHRAVVIASLLDSLADRCRSQGCRSLILLGLRTTDQVLNRVLDERAFAGGLLTMAASFDVGSVDSFEEYCEQRSRSVRRRFRQDRNAFGASGFQVRTIDPMAHVDIITELEANVLEKHLLPSDPPVDRAELRVQKEAEMRWLGDTARVFACFDGDDIIATNTCFATGRRFIDSTFGLDAERARDVPVYRHLGYEVPLRAAIEMGCVEVFAGFEAYEPKLLRGAELAGRSLHLMGLDPESARVAADLVSVVDQANRRFFNEHFGRPVSQDDFRDGG